MASRIENQGTARSNLTRALKERNRSSFELSVTIGKNRTYIDDFLRSKKSGISATSAKEIADALDIDLIYVIGSKPLPENTEAASFKIDRNQKKLEERSERRNEVALEVRSSKDPEERVNVYGVPHLLVKDGVYPLPLLQTDRRRVYHRRSVIRIWDFPLDYVENDLNSLIECIDMVSVSNGELSSDIVVDRLSFEVTQHEYLYAIMHDNKVIVRRVSRSGMHLKILDNDGRVTEAVEGSDYRVIGRVRLRLCKT